MGSSLCWHRVCREKAAYLCFLDKDPQLTSEQWSRQCTQQHSALEDGTIGLSPVPVQSQGKLVLQQRSVKKRHRTYTIHMDHNDTYSYNVLAHQVIGLTRTRERATSQHARLPARPPLQQALPGDTMPPWAHEHSVLVSPVPSGAWD